MSIETDITNALYAKISEAVKATNIPAMPVQYPLRSFNRPNNGTWLEVIHIRNNRTNEFWGAERTFQGLVRLILHWSNNDAGIFPAIAYLDQLAALIPKGTILSFGDASVLIYDNPDVGSLIVDNGLVMVPLTLMYRDFYSAG